MTALCLLQRRGLAWSSCGCRGAGGGEMRGGGSLPGAWLGPQLALAGHRAPVTGVSCGPIGQQFTKKGLRETLALGGQPEYAWGGTNGGL